MKKIIEDTEISYKKIGMHLPRKTKQEIIKKKNQITKLASEFGKAVNKTYENGLWFKKEELLGIPEEVVNNFKFDSKKKKYFVSVKPAEFMPLRKFCKIEKTRKVLTEIFTKGAGDANLKRHSEILKLKKEIIDILGYKTWSEFVITDEMYDTQKNVSNFIKVLSQITDRGFREEMKDIKEIIKKYNKVYKTKLEVTNWNFDFIENIKKQSKTKVDENLYKPYFELENVKKVLFKIWEDLFDIEVKYIKSEKFFSDDTEFYEFKNKRTGEILSHGVFDLFPRKGKFGHACMADISKTHIDINGDRYTSFIFLVCNFMKGKDVSLLSFREVSTFFHEAGHFLHHILMQNKYISTGSVSRDFVEIPSQFFENFLQDENFVKANFKHYETGAEMEEKLIRNIKEISKDTYYQIKRQLQFIAYDQEIHGKNISAYIKNFKKLKEISKKYVEQITKVKVQKDYNIVSTFEHVIAGYDARYHSYMISLIHAHDFWKYFTQKGINKNEFTEKYKKLLMAAGTKKEKDLVKEFLGREVSFTAFLENLK
jgi:Zn-dependent oligopeptidase